MRAIADAPGHTARRAVFALAVVSLLLVLRASGVHADTGALQIAVNGGTANAEVAVIGTTGVLGGTVSVVIRLSNDVASAAVSADLDIGFPTDVVRFYAPVSENCRVAPRLAGTHLAGGTVPEPGLLRVAIFNPTSLEPLRDGSLAACDFSIRSDAAAPTARLTIHFVELFGAAGAVPVVGVPGLITISDFGSRPTPTVPPDVCAGDCDGDRAVTIAELIRAVGIALGARSVSACLAADGNRDGTVTVAELVTAVNRTLRGC